MIEVQELLMHVLPRKIALIAGAGTASQEAVLFCQESGVPYLYIALQGHADPHFIPETPHFYQVPLGYVGHMLDLLKKHHVQDILFIGGVQRPSWSDLNVDAEGRRWLCEWGRRLFQGDHGILELIREKMESLGYRIVGLHQLVPRLIPETRGPLTMHHPTSEDVLDIQKGASLLEALSSFDVGQAVVVHQGMVLGIEGPEGTQNLITRSLALRAQPSGGILIKAPKTQQDRRLDLPVIGPDTAQHMADLKGTGIALQAGGVMILDQERVCAILNHAGMFLSLF